MAKVYIEVRPPPGTGGDLSPRAALPELLINRLNELGDSLRDIASGLSKRLSEFGENADKNWQMDEVELKFSLDLEAEAGIIVARTSATAGFEATLKWKRAT